MDLRDLRGHAHPAIQWDGGIRRSTLQLCLPFRIGHSVLYSLYSFNSFETNLLFQFNSPYHF